MLVETVGIEPTRRSLRGPAASERRSAGRSGGCLPWYSAESYRPGTCDEPPECSISRKIWGPGHEPPNLKPADALPRLRSSLLHPDVRPSVRVVRPQANGVEVSRQNEAPANFPIGTVVRANGKRGKVLDHPLYTAGTRPLRPYLVAFPEGDIDWFAADELEEAEDV